MTAYYNEIDPYAAQWLRNLIEAGHIAYGVVDERSIEDVRPDEIAGYTQCHFFAGIGVWSYALRLAGWPDDEPVWTGSCPCQPFSQAGKGAGFADERHLWPAWDWLISECRPSVILGEQVASKDIDPWIDLVQADLEAMGYAIGCVPFPSAGVGAPHIRDRAYFMAYSNNARSQGRKRVRERAAERFAGPCGVAGILADANGGKFDGLSVVRGIERNGQDAGRPQGIGESEPCGDVCELADAMQPGRPEGRPIAGDRSVARLRCAGGMAGADGWHAGTEGIQRGRQHGQQPEDGRIERIEPAGPTNGFWRDADWLSCRDDKWRPVEPGTFPLVNGSDGRVGRVRADQERLTAQVPRKDQGSRVGRLRAYGNVINAQAAKVFIESAMDCMP